MSPKREGEKSPKYVTINDIETVYQKITMMTKLYEPAKSSSTTFGIVYAVPLEKDNETRAIIK